MPRRFADVEGLRLAYLEEGSGDPIVLLHGNPTSSFLWRGVLPHLAGFGRCIAPDLPGMGHSEKVPGGGDAAYRFVEHRRRLDGLLEDLAVRHRAVLVGHDWGGVLLVDWAKRHPGAVRGIAFGETLATPVTSTGPNAPEPSFFGPLRGPDGERLVLDENLMVEAVLPAGTVRALSPAEMAEYRRPYALPGESRRPTLTWARQIPIDGRPADVHTVVAANAAFMATTSIPKLLIDGDPGALLTGPMRDVVRAWPELSEIRVPGLHFLPEDSPDAIGARIAAWLTTLD